MGTTKWSKFLAKATAQCKEEEYAKYVKRMNEFQRTKERMEQAASGQDPEKDDDASRNEMSLTRDGLLESGKSAFERYFRPNSPAAGGRGNRPLRPAGRGF